MPKLCSIDGCDRKHSARGFCRPHYRQWKRTSPESPRCSIDGCDRPHDARGWCATHYQRWKSNGDPLVVQNVWHYGDEAARRESAREAKRRWRLANPDKMSAARADWAARHPEKVRQYRRDRKKRDPVSNRAYVRARTARLRNLPVYHSAEGIRQRIAFYGDRCWMCGGPWDTIDHVKPIAKGGAHMLCNLRPACTECNSKKGAKWPFMSSSLGTASARTDVGLSTGYSNATQPNIPLGPSV